MRSKQYSDGVIKTENGEYKIDEIKEIIDARTGDLINFISKTIEESGFNGYLGKGLAFTGGAVSIDEIFSKVGSKMECAVRKVAPFPLRGLENVNPSMSTVIGVLLTKLEAEFKKRNEKMEESLKDEVTAIEKEEEIFVTELPINETAFRQEDYEEEYEAEVATDGTLNKIKKWISNFI